MKFGLKKRSATEFSRADVLVFPVTKESWKKYKFPFGFGAPGFAAQLKRLQSEGGFEAAAETVARLVSGGPKKPDYIYFVGVGSKKDFNSGTLRKSIGALTRSLLSAKVKNITVDLAEIVELDTVEDCIASVVEGIQLGGYRFLQYLDDKKAKEKAPSLISATLLVEGTLKSAYQSAIDRAFAGSVGVNIARNLANTPANDLTPSRFVELAKKQFGSDKAFKITVIDEAQAKKLGMGSFLSVAVGSDEPSYILAVSYSPVKKGKTIALVGKGVTFDTGGVSIKPSLKMSEMKGDMSGAAAVFGTLIALQMLRPKQNVLAVMPLTENMVNGKATRPGDVVRAMNGKTIEILNTDAEGRLILADALYWAVQQGADELIDIATLTGACTVALGDVRSGLLGNDTKMIRKMQAIGDKTGDKLWELPMDDEYFDLLKSEVADMSNCSEGRLAGTISAAKFLEQFVDEKPWIHLDIAGAMHYSRAFGYQIAGMSGTGVRNLLAYVLTH